MDERTLNKKLKFIEDYKQASNASSGSEVDANANVTSKNIATMSTELSKKDFIDLNRAITKKYLFAKYGQELCDQFDNDLKNHIIYSHDETSVMPYTYSSKEVVNVKYNGVLLLTSLEQLYDLVTEEEVLLDAEKSVWGKYPNNLDILDRYGWTKVSRLIKKERHRNLVRVKTYSGEDIVVTDNHPLIVSDNTDDTIDAINGLGYKQFKYQNKLEWNEHTTVALNDICSPLVSEQFNGYFTTQVDKGCKVFLTPNTLDLTEELGYFIGFFVGDGNYSKNDCDNIQITQKDRSVLVKLANIGIKYFNATPHIRKKNGDVDCYTLNFYSPSLAFILRDYFKIGDYAQRKTLPINILETNKKFAKGVIWGLIDSDGVVSGSRFSIRISSRTGVNQLCWLLKDLGYTVGTEHSSGVVGFQGQLKKGYTQNYDIWGVASTVTSDELLCDYSFKSKLLKSNSKGLKYRDGWVNITDVSVLDDSLFVEEQNKFIYDITTESHSFICNNLWVHNCVAISLYPFLLDGLKKLGGTSGAPKHANSFVGGLCNLIFLIAGQFAGAVAIPEFIPYLDHFLRVDYGNDYIAHLDEPVWNIGNNQITVRHIIEDLFQEFVYCVNQPAAARGYQSPFTNIAYFDEGYFDSIFKDFIFPDGDEPCWETTKELQKLFMKWFNKERTKEVITFPVETMNLLWDKDTKKYVDEEMADFTATSWSEGHSFFLYNSDSADALSSCCRLKNAIEENVFSYTLGAGGIETGSKKVITLNINRIVQNWFNDEVNKKYKRNRLTLNQYIENIVSRVHKYLEAWNDHLWDMYNSGLLTVYSAGFIDLDKQYLTVGFNGFIEGAEFLKLMNEYIPDQYKDLEIRPNNVAYKQYAKDILNTIKELNLKDRTEHLRYIKITINDVMYNVPVDAYINVTNISDESKLKIKASEVLKNINMYEIDTDDLLSYVV